MPTLLDLNDFTTLIFYSMGFNLFTLRQASRRSWRINQAAPRVEVYLLYYKDTMQAKAMKLMASKLAVAGIIEGTLSEEGLAAMSDVRDLTFQMARWCLHKLSANGGPNSDTANLNSGNKSICGLGIAGGNASPAFQNEKAILRTCIHKRLSSVWK